MADQRREDTATTIARRALLVRGGLLGFLALVAPSLLAAGEAEAGRAFKKRRGFKRVRVKKHRGFGKRRSFKRVRFKKHHGFKRHRGFKARVSFKKHHGFRKHRGFRKARFVRFKKRW